MQITANRIEKNPSLTNWRCEILFWELVSASRPDDAQNCADYVVRTPPPDWMFWLAAIVAALRVWAGCVSSPLNGHFLTDCRVMWVISPDYRPVRGEGKKWSHSGIWTRGSNWDSEWGAGGGRDLSSGSPPLLVSSARRILSPPDGLRGSRWSL